MHKKEYWTLYFVLLFNSFQIPILRLLKIDHSPVAFDIVQCVVCLLEVAFNFIMIERSRYPYFLVRPVARNILSLEWML